MSSSPSCNGNNVRTATNRPLRAAVLAVAVLTAACKDTSGPLSDEHLPFLGSWIFSIAGNNEIPFDQTFDDDTRGLCVYTMNALAFTFYADLQFVEDQIATVVCENDEEEQGPFSLPGAPGTYTVKDTELRMRYTGTTTEGRYQFVMEGDQLTLSSTSQTGTVFVSVLHKQQEPEDAASASGVPR